MLYMLLTPLWEDKTYLTSQIIFVLLLQRSLTAAPRTKCYTCCWCQCETFSKKFFPSWRVIGGRWSSISLCFAPCPWLGSHNCTGPLWSPCNCSWNSGVSACGVLSYSPLTLSLNLWRDCWYFHHGRWHLQKTNSFALTDGHVIEIIMSFTGRRYMTFPTRLVVDYWPDENVTKLTCLSFQFMQQFKDNISFLFLISLSLSLTHFFLQSLFI